MGCDIHFYTEVKQPDGTWKLHGELVRDGDDEDSWVSCSEELYDGRNYNLFAILADVRNGRGFAGIKTGEGFNPISDPRGVPDDASPEYKKIVEQWDCDGHSHSYHTLRQLLDFDWTQCTGLQGFVSVNGWLSWSRYRRARGFGPEEYCGGVNGPDVKHFNAEQMDNLVQGFYDLDSEQRAAFLKEHSGVYGLATWNVPYYRVSGTFLDETVPQLLKLAGGTAGIDNVRIVFFFDN